MLYIEHFGLGENRQQRQNDMGNFLLWPDALAMQFKTMRLNGFQMREIVQKLLRKREVLTIEFQNKLSK